jgi:hypothetical protein
MLERINAVPRILPNGGLFIPKELLPYSKILIGDKQVIVNSLGDLKMVRNNTVILEKLQKKMRGEAERTGLTSEEAIYKICREMREGV